MLAELQQPAEPQQHDEPQQLAEPQQAADIADDVLQLRGGGNSSSDSKLEPASRLPAGECGEDVLEPVSRLSAGGGGEDVPESASSLPAGEGGLEFVCLPMAAEGWSDFR